MAKSKLVKANEEIAAAVAGGYKKVEEAVVGGYKKIEDAFVDRYLTHDGESVEEAKSRLAAEQAERQAAEQSGREGRVAEAKRRKEEARAGLQ